MSLPADLAARHLFDSLRALNQRPAAVVLAQVDTKLIDSLERRLRAALDRERSGSVIPDGFRTNTAGGVGGGMAIVVADENGNPDRVPVTAVEAAAIALADGNVIKDKHRDYTRGAARSLEDAVVNLHRLMGFLASIDDLMVTTGPAPRTCGHCTGKRGNNTDRPVAHRGTVGDRLERPMDLCEACWWFVQQTAKPATRQGYLPTDQQIAWHEERGRWRIRVA